MPRHPCRAPGGPPGSGDIRGFDAPGAPRPPFSSLDEANDGFGESSRARPSLSPVRSGTAA
jgi:hypothetical protein